MLTINLAKPPLKLRPTKWEGHDSVYWAPWRRGGSYERDYEPMLRERVQITPEDFYTVNLEGRGDAKPNSRQAG